jgi:hypothetical protein
VACSVTGWSAVASATANATLAAVLAGFMLNGIILLLGNRTMAAAAGYVQALSLLFAAFVALGLDAYLFGLVTGDGTRVIGTVSACRRTWTEAMFAAGLLGIGTGAIIVGFVFLFAVYFEDARRGKKEEEDDFTRSLDMLETLCNFLRAGVTLVVVAILYMTARSYLLALFGGEVPIWGKIFIYAYLVIGLVVAGVFIISAAVAHSINDSWISRLLRVRKEKLITALKRAIFTSVGYSILTVIFATVTATTAAHFWASSHLAVKAVALLTVIWISMVSLLPLVLLTGRTVPEFAPRAETSGTPRSQQRR